MEKLKSKIEKFFEEETMLRLVDYFIAKLSEGDEVELGGYFIEGNPRFECRSVFLEHPFVHELMKAVDCVLMETESTIEEPLGVTRDCKIDIRINVKNEIQFAHIMDILYPYVNPEWIQTVSRCEKALMPLCIGDYLPLYYLGVVFHGEELKSIRTYFKTFGLNEDAPNIDTLVELERIEELTEDKKQIQIIKTLTTAGLGNLRCVGLQFDLDTSNQSTKYYFKPYSGNADFFDAFEELVITEGYKDSYSAIKEGFLNDPRLMLDIVQVNMNEIVKSKYMKFYFKPQGIQKEDFFKLKEGLVIRDICGVCFLIDIHEKNYYNLKSLYRLNEIGREIILFAQSKGVFNIDSIVCDMKRKILGYRPEMYAQMYSDFKGFVLDLNNLGYVEKVS